MLKTPVSNAGAYFPQNFKELPRSSSACSRLNDGDPFSHHSNDPLRPLIMQGFKAMIDEYAMVGTCDAAPVANPDSVMDPDADADYITVPQLDLDLSQHPMILQGEPDDEPWRQGIASKFAAIDRLSLTRKRV